MVLLVTYELGQKHHEMCAEKHHSLYPGSLLHLGQYSHVKSKLTLSVFFAH